MDIVNAESKIRTRHQVTIPKEIRTKAKLKVGDTLIWRYNEVHQEIVVMLKPESFADKLWGLGKEIWKRESADEYIRNERSEW